MPLTRKHITKEVRDLLFFPLISLLQSYLMCSRCPREYFLSVYLFTFIMWVLLWKGNTLLSGWLSGKISWRHYPVKRLLAGIVLNMGYTILAVVLLIEVFEYFSISFGERSRYTIYGAVIVTILISFFLHARDFLFFWRKAAFEKERYEKESIIARYESLKDQISPHFLFNSLNALTNLVYEDPDKAVSFIKQLSEVYRYVLETRYREVVALSEELKFLEAYLYLQRIRFGNKLIVEIDQMDETIQVPPLALQLLIENAIKHNIVSEDDPLTIRLYSQGDFLVVENNLQKKTTLSGETSSGIGLENISRRYEFLSNKKVLIDENGKTFVVKIPIVKEFKG